MGSGAGSTTDVRRNSMRSRSALFGAIALSVLLPTLYVIYIGIDQTEVQHLLYAFLSRHLLAFGAAAYWRISKRHGPGLFVVCFVLPTLVLFNAALVLNGLEELWPPILGVDVALFMPAILVVLPWQARRKADSGGLL